MKRDIFWSALDSLAAALFSIVTSFVVARLIGPAELGVGAAAVGMHVVLWVAVNALFADALVQAETVNDRMLSSAFWASGIAGCAAAVVQVTVGLILGALMQDSRLRAMGVALSLPLPLVGVAGAMQGLLTRQRAYRRLALRTMIGQGSGTLVGIAGALSGLGGWALVSQQAVTSTVGALALLAGAGWCPARCLDPGAVRRLLAVGAPLTASTLVLIARYRLFAVLVGGVAGPTVLGQVHVAFRLVDSVRELAFGALWRLMLPSLSQCQAIRHNLLREVDRWVRVCAAAFLPGCAVATLLITPLVRLLLGPGWTEAGHAAIPLLLLAAWSALGFPGGVALVALGKVRFTLYGNLASLGAACAFVLLFPPASASQAVMIWVAAQLLVSPYVLWINGRALGVGVWRPLTGGFRARVPS